MKTIQYIEKGILFLVIITLPFTNVPVLLNIPVISGNLPMFMAMLGVIIMGIESIIFKDVIIPWKKYILIFFLWNILCLWIGVVTYPFYEMQMPTISMSQKFQTISVFIEGLTGYEIRTSFYSFMVFFWRFVKIFIIIGIGTIILIFHLYRNNWKNGINLMSLAAYVLTIECIVYSIPESLWLWTKNPMFKNVSDLFNDFIVIHGDGSLSWEGQLKSLFSEPSFFGIGMAFVMPLLWYRTFEKKNMLGFFMIILLSLMFFMTQSRTAIILYIGEILIIILLGINMKYPYWKRYSMYILGMAILGFSINIAITNISDIQLQPSKTLTQQYVENNILSVIKIEKRSNRARYGYMDATALVGMEHPIFGVGYGFESLYMKNKFPIWAQEDNEIRRYNKQIIKVGITEYMYPLINQYTYLLAQSGVVGLVLFILPILWLLALTWKCKDLLNDFGVICVVVLFIGQLACMMSSAFWITYPLSFGLLSCIILEKLNNKDK